MSKQDAIKKAMRFLEKVFPGETEDEFEAIAILIVAESRGDTGTICDALYAAIDYCNNLIKELDYGKETNDKGL